MRYVPVTDAEIVNIRRFAQRERERSSGILGIVPEDHVLDRVLDELADLRRVAHVIEALADALTEDNTYDEDVLMGPTVSVTEAQTYPAIISERTDVIRRLRAALHTEVAP